MSSNTGNRRQQMKEQTRRDILNAAYELFEQKGYEGTTMRALAARAGVGLGTIFQHFQDKPSLLVAAFEEDLNRLSLEGHASLPQGDLKNQWLHICRYVLGFYAERPLLGRVIVKEGLFLQGEAAEKMERLNAQISQRIIAALEAAKQRGEVRSDLDVNQAAISVWGIYIMAVLTGFQAPKFDVDMLIEMLGRQFDLLMQGMGAVPRG